MPDELPAKFAAFRDRTRYQRSGIVLVKAVHDEAVDAVAVALPGDCISWPKLVVSSLRPGQRFTDQSPEAVLARLQKLAMEEAPFLGRVVEGLDIAIANWERGAVETFWEDFAALRRHPARAVVAVMPSAVPQLLPHPHLMTTLTADKRLIKLD